MPAKGAMATYADTGYQTTWDVTRGQPGSAGILVDYTGGNIGNSFGSGTPSSRAQQFLGQILRGVAQGMAVRQTDCRRFKRPLCGHSRRSAHEAGVTACIGKVEGISSLEREISALCLELVEH